MAKVTVEEALITLGVKYGTDFTVENNPDNPKEVRLVSINHRIHTVHTNFVSQDALNNYIAERLDRR